MPNLNRPAEPLDQVELLLRRALRNALSGSLVLGLGGACGTSVQNGSSPPDGGHAPMQDAAAHPDAAANQDASAPRDAAADAGLAPAGPPVSCPDGVSYPVKASGLTTATPFEYVAIRGRSFGYGEQDVDAGTAWTVPLTGVTVMSETGTACKTATSNTCADEVSHHQGPPVVTSCIQRCFELSVVTTRGNDVQRWVGLDALRSLLGPIDSPDDALLLVSAAGYDLTCNDAVRTSVTKTADGFTVYATKMTSDCSPIIITRFELHVSTSGEITVADRAELSRDGACVGRKPAGLRSQSVDRGKSPLGDFLSRCAHLEAASVISFKRLARELRAHAAPLELVARAEQARVDEVQHALVVGDLARQHGGVLAPVDVDDLPLRELEEIALENAVEGCVRETYGALLGAHQAEQAENAALKLAMVRIAADEARHASLSHAVHAWIWERLDMAARQRVWTAQVRTILDLMQEARIPCDLVLQREAGLPSPAVASRLVTELMQTLWRSPLANAA